MYFSQPRPQSPARQVLHDPSAPWSRLQHPMLSQAGPQPNQSGVVGAPPQSSYGLVQYTNGGAHHNPNLVPHHHHHQSITSYISSHYHSPSHLHATHRQPTASPPPQPAAPVPKHWQTQLDHADVSRKSTPRTRVLNIVSSYRLVARQDHHMRELERRPRIRGIQRNRSLLLQIPISAPLRSPSPGR